MEIKKIESDKPLLILLHGGNSSGEEWNDLIDTFKEDYSLWIPTFSGHGHDENGYTSIYENAEELYHLAKEKYSSVKVIGRGLGGQVALRMMEFDKDFISHVILESCLCVPTGLLKWMLVFNAKVSYYPKEGQMNKKNFIKMIKDNSSFMLQQSIVDFEGKALILYASDEDKLMKKSASYLKEYLKNSKLIELPYGHGMGLTHRDELLEYWKPFLNDELDLEDENNNENEENIVDNSDEEIKENKQDEDE